MDTQKVRTVLCLKSRLTDVYLEYNELSAEFVEVSSGKLCMNSQGSATEQAECYQQLHCTACSWEAVQKLEGKGTKDKDDREHGDR